MKKFPVLLSIFLQILISNEVYGYESRTYLHGEVVRDIVNYSNEDKRLIARGRFTENIDDTFIFNCSALRDIEEEKNQYIWNLELLNINDHFDFIAGNFNLRFGSGLIMGKKKFISSDSFTRSLTVSFDEHVIPATGTNPSGAFFGTAAKIYAEGDEFSAGVIPFISVQKRYISSEELEQGYISSSLSTLSEKTTGNSRYSESADIINYGGMIWFSYIDCITVQAYGFSTELLDPERKNMEWEYDTLKKSGIKGYRASGFFIEYSDETVSLFIEPVFSIREYDSSVTGKAVLWGAGIKNRTILLSVRGKNCDPDFRAEYASGERNPENAFEIKAGIIPSKNFELGALLFSEKKINPSYSSEGPSGSVREEIYAGIKPCKRIKLNLTGARARSCNGNSEAEKMKLSSSLLFSLPRDIYFRIKSDIQSENSSEAAVLSCELKYLFYNHFTLSAGYSEIHAGCDSGVYAAVIPAAEAELCADLYNRDARAAALKLKYKKEDLSFHGRISLIEKGGERETTAESSLGFVF